MIRLGFEIGIKTKLLPNSLSYPHKNMETNQSRDIGFCLSYALNKK
jgi:hypothetical protein